MAGDTVPTQILTFKYRLLPTRKQHAVLAEILESQRHLYNAALEERIGCWKKTGKGLSYTAQSYGLTELRSDPEFSAISISIQRWTLRRVDDAFLGFFKRAQRGIGKAGFPRFRGAGWWKSFGFSQYSESVRFDGKRVRFKGVPSGIRVHVHRPMPAAATIKTCVVTRDRKGWSISFQCLVSIEKCRRNRRTVGVDVGLTKLATLSNGETIPNPHLAKNAERELRRRNRALSRCKRDSKRREKMKARVSRLHRKISNTRRTFLHQESSRLAQGYGTIVVEDLRIKNMLRAHMAKPIHDAGWRIFIDMLEYKAVRAGGRVIKVNPKGTSQACSACGETVPKGLRVRIHNCRHCGLVMDRDENAAVNILARAVTGPGRPKAP